MALRFSLLLWQGLALAAAASTQEDAACMMQMASKRQEAQSAAASSYPYETAKPIPVSFNLHGHRAPDKSVLIAGLVKSLDADNAENIKSALKFCKFFDYGNCGMSVMAPHEEVQQNKLREILDIDKTFDMVPDPGNIPHEGPRPYMLAGFRNALLEHVFEKEWDYLIMADLDNTVHWDDQTFGVMLNALEKPDEWDAVAFSGTNYYDWWAARCDEYSKNCLSHKICSDRSQFPCIMETLQDENPDHFRPVRSAFNGLAIYKRGVVGDCKYDATNRDDTAPGHKDCEHVGFHDCLKGNGARMMLNAGRLHTWWSSLPPEDEQKADEAKEEPETSEEEPEASEEEPKTWDENSDS